MDAQDGGDVSDQRAYSMHMDVLCGYLAKVDVPQIVAACEESWWSQTLCEVNDCVIRLAVVQGEFHWHKHDAEDEFFFVVEGRLLLDVENGTPGGETIPLDVHEGYTVPKGTLHRTRAPERVVMLMVEKGTVEPTGD